MLVAALAGAFAAGVIATLALVVGLGWWACRAIARGAGRP